MNEKPELKQYYKEAGLILLGAILASLPILVTNYMQTRAQQHQLIMDRRITALRDYSTSYNKLASDILPSIDQLEGMVTAAEEQYTSRQLTNDEWDRLETQTDEVVSKVRSWVAEVNTQTVIVNALFRVNLNQRTFAVRKAAPTNGEKNSGDACLKCLKDTITGLKDHTIQNFNDQQKIIRELGEQLLHD